MFYVAEQTQARLPCADTHKNPLGLFVLPPSCRLSKASWTVYACSTFLLLGQSNNVTPSWCSGVASGPRSLPPGSKVKKVWEWGGSSNHMTWDPIKDEQAPLDAFIVETTRPDPLFSNAVNVLLIISDSGEKFSFWLFATGAPDEICADLGKKKEWKKSHLNSLEMMNLVLIESHLISGQIWFEKCVTSSSTI